LNYFLVAADHHAIAALKAPNATARSDIQIVNSQRTKSLRPFYVVDVIGIAAIDNCIARFQQG
jgi:hypothetical protein